MHPVYEQTAQGAYPTMAEKVFSSCVARMSSELPSATQYLSELALGKLSTIC